MITLKPAFAAALAALLAFSLPAAAQDRGGMLDKGNKGKSARIDKQDRQALEKLAQGDMAEIAAGKLAQKKASSPEVKKFGEHMVKEHSKMLQEGTQVAKAKGLQPPTRPDRKHEAALKKLEKLSGEDFDREFMAQMVKDHEDALELAEKTAKDAKDPQVKAHAEKGAPHIKDHLAQARKLGGELGASIGSSGLLEKRKK